mmetsp:Transcript_26123/g.36010  ORF Transcript_26123/g.36010 Transcript_26123/m.36010 type:complete len:348 (+) Transcript_26123:1-1044(+)
MKLAFIISTGIIWETSWGSYGDRDYYFISCTTDLFTEYCRSNDRLLASEHLSLINQSLIHWTCLEACEYECMTKITSQRLESNGDVLKYYGHWPFIRYFGIEEPASVIFSLLNAVYHLKFSAAYILRGISGIKSEIGCHPQIASWIFLYSTAATLAWVMSSIYHSKKTPYATELDLTFAMGVLVTGLLVVIRRLMGLRCINYIQGCSLFLVGFFGFAIRAKGIFDGSVSFSSHMYSSIALFVITTTLWCYWACFYDENSLIWTQRRTSDMMTHSKQRRARWLCLLCNIWLLLAALLEVLDFPPIWGIFDAHSLWHAATIPLGPLWYYFWELDYHSQLQLEEEEEKKQ